MRLVNWRALVVGAAGLGLAACGDDVTISQQPITFSTNPQAVSCAAGQATAVGISVSGGSGASSISFTPSGAGVTAGTSSANSFSFTCGAAGTAGVINFTITSGGQTANGSIPVTVAPATGTGQATVTAITVSPSAVTLVPGQSTTVTAQVTLANGAPATTSTAVTFTSSDTSVTVTQAANSATATITARVPAGSNPNAFTGRQVVITATAVASPAATPLRAFSTVTIAPTSSIIASLVVSPSSISIATGGTQQISGQVNLGPSAPAGTSTGLTYVSSDTSVAKVSSTGLVTGTGKSGTAIIYVVPSAICSATVAAATTPTAAAAAAAACPVVQQIGVTVTSPAPVRLTIQSLTQISALNGTQVPIDPSNVQGNIIATLNLDPGTFTPDSVTITLGNVRQTCQRFTIQLAEALRASLTDGSADFAPIQCIINTSAFNATTGAALVQNGVQALAATVFYRPNGGTSAQQQTASINQQLTLQNTSGFFASVTNAPGPLQLQNGSPGQATGPQGVLWRAGSIIVSVLPVNFSANSPGVTGFSPVTVSLVDNGNGGGAARIVATQTASSNAGPAQVVFFGDTDEPNQTGFNPNANNLVGYTSPAPGAPGTQVLLNNNVPTFANGAPLGTFVVIGGNAVGNGTVVLNANGQPLTQPQLNPNPAPPIGSGLPVTNANVAAALFIDNQAPQAVAQANFPTTNFATSFDPVTQSPTRVNGFFNINQQFTAAAFQFAFIDPVLGTLVPGNPDFNGVDRVSYQFFAGTSGAGINTGFLTGLTPVSTAAQLQPRLQNSFYRLATAAVDALGNRRNQFVSQIFNPNQPNATSVQTFFNVDLLRPTLAQIKSANPTTFASRVSSDTTVFGPRAVRMGFSATSNVGVVTGSTFTLPPELAFSASDDIGFGPLALQIQLTRYRRVNGNLVVECLTIDSNGNLAGAAGLQGFADLATTNCPVQLATLNPIQLPNNVSAVYVGTAQARDQAGNLSDPVPINAVVDVVPPSGISISLPQTLVGNQAVSFTAGATDNLAVASGAPRVGYNSLAFPLIYNPNAVLNLATVFSRLQTIATGPDPFGLGSPSALPNSQASLTLTIPNFIRSITNTNVGSGTPGAFSVASTLGAEIFDLASNSAFTSVGIPAANISSAPASSPYVNATNGVNNVQTFGLTVAAGSGAQSVNGATICGPVTGNCAQTATFQVVQQGQANTFISQFVRLELYVFDPTVSNGVGVPPGGYRFLTAVPTGSVTDLPGLPRQITSLVPLASNTQPFFLAPQAGTQALNAPVYQVIAIGTNASGDALVSNVVPVTILP